MEPEGAPEQQQPIVLVEKEEATPLLPPQAPPEPQPQQQAPATETQAQPQQQAEEPGPNVHHNIEVKEVAPDAFEQPMNGQQARNLAIHLIHSYFTTQQNALVRHHIESYDQFLSRDLQSIIASYNPITIMKNPKALVGSSDFKYTAEIFIGGESGKEIFIGTPTVVLDQGNDVRVLFPNEARLRNLTYAVQIEANILVRVSIRTGNPENPVSVTELPVFRIPICNMPLMLHSGNCILHNKSKILLQQMGECPQDHGGYFIVDGAEKTLITRQEGAFNTLWITEQKADPLVQYYCSLSSLNPKSREVKRVSFYWTREVTRQERSGQRRAILRQSVMEVSIPFVLKPIPIFVLFRALGIQTDADILKLIFPDPKSPEALYLADLLIPSVNAAAPFLDSYSAVQYIKTLTKGFSEAHVLDIVHNHLFPHVEDLPGARASYLADCVRKILRVVKGIDQPPSRDDTRNQRLLTSGFLCQMLFQNLYKEYVKLIQLKVAETYVYNESIYSNMDFVKIFSEANRRQVFAYGHITQGIMRGFKGKWTTGPQKVESGVLQELSRLSYLDFTSHLRRVVLNFDTSMKLQGPRRLHTSQYGYFCTSETPSGSHIGVTKNMSIMTAISTGSYAGGLLNWLFQRGTVLPCDMVTPELATVMVPVYLNSGIIGYTANAQLLARVLRMFKRSGFLPPLSSNGYSIPERKVFIYMDDGRPLRPLIICEPHGHLPGAARFGRRSWRDYVVGMLRQGTQIGSREFADPLGDKAGVSLADYMQYFEQNAALMGLIEYIDPYEQNEVLIANYPEHILKETTHMEVHPSTIVGLLGNCIPYPNHNQSPRNQLSASQSKQGLSLYATNFQNRFDNTANVLCYGQAPLARTIYQDYFGDGRMPYGQNIILAMGMYGGYNQEDGIIMNADALARGQFRSINYRSYEAYEEDDERSHIQIRIGNPKQIPAWLELKTNLDYTKLDDAGLIRVGEYVDQNTVIVGRYQVGESGVMTDASVTPQVWTRGRVEKVVITVNNMGLRLVKVRIAQDRMPELGDKFSNRHGQKGTINVLYRGHDMPRTADGITPDMIMNPTAIPSRMTIGQILEMIIGNVGAELGAVGNVTAFMNDGSPNEILGQILEKLGLHKMSNQVLYNGMTGEQIHADIFMGVVYGMRLKHMTEDKWNARGQGRKEQRTHQPTGGRGNEGGMKLGEMERDAIIAHGTMSFQQESYMARSDGTDFIVCNGCGTIPIYNERQGLYLCPLCDGPIQYSGNTASTLEPIPPPVRSAVTFSKVEMPYATKLFFQELNTFMNMSARLLTTRDTTRLRGMDNVEELAEVATEGAAQPLEALVYPEVALPALPEKTAAPMAVDVQKSLALLNEEARSAYQAESAAAAEEQVELAPASVAPLAPVTPPTPPQQATPVQQAPLEQATPVQQATTAQPGSTADLVVAQTAEGAPIMTIDTSEAALQAEGLTQPTDAASVPAPRAPSIRRVIRRTQQTQQSQQQQPSAPPAGQEDQEDSEKPASTGPVTVIKLG